MPDPNPSVASALGSAPAQGRVDIHSHLIPAVDDGSLNAVQSVDMIRVLMAHGYSGSICTPHLWPQLYPQNTPAAVAAWTNALLASLEREGLSYRLWAGGELRIFPGVIDWMREVGVPTLAGSRCVLCDFWDESWPACADEAFDWLIERDYTPILAHPERINIADLADVEAHLDDVQGRGVLLQGNLRCFTGEEGPVTDERVRRWMDQGRYTFLALDTHRPDTLPGRLDGIELAAADFGREAVERRLREAVWERVLAGCD